MNYRLFQYALPAPPELEDLNAYLSSHRIASVSREMVQTGNGAMLVFIVETVAGKAPAGTPQEQAKIDYRDVFNDADFAVFSRLRDERKKIALAEGVPIYTVFSNAQLAEMVKRRAKTVAELGAIEGIGMARVEKHGAQMVALLSGS